MPANPVFQFLGDRVQKGSPYAIGALSICPVCNVGVLWPVGWIKMKLGMKVGLGPGHIVLDGDPAPPPKKMGTAATSYPNFRPMSIVAKRLDGSRCHLVRG